jgi:hypothetical protein
MNYFKHYETLTERAKSRKIEGYKVKHHIIPKCLGGSDSPLNIVELTPEEHFVAHQLLVKMYPGHRGLIIAVQRMCTGSSKNLRNKWYGWLRKRYSHSISGENNPSSKFTNNQVLEIYHSNDTIDNLSKKYNVTRYNIITIKRKIYYTNITKDIKELPGCSDEDLFKKGGGFPLPIDLIKEVFYDSGDYSYFWEKYKITPIVVKSIKNKKSFKKITSKLGTPGQVKRYGLTRDMIEEIFNEEGTNSEIAEKYGIHYNTVRNIKGKYSRAYDIWEDF